MESQLEGPHHKKSRPCEAAFSLKTLESPVLGLDGSDLEGETALRAGGGVRVDHFGLGGFV